MRAREENWQEYLDRTGIERSKFDEDNAHAPASVMPGYEAPISEAEILGAGGGTPSVSMDVAGPIEGLHASPEKPKPLFSDEDFRRMLQPKPPRDTSRLEAAARLDRKRQNEDDLRMLLLAAGRRESPHLRNLGTPQTDSAKATQQPEEDELTRALRVAQLKRLVFESEPDPLKTEKTQAEIDALRALAGQRATNPDKLEAEIDANRALAEQRRRTNALALEKTQAEIDALKALEEQRRRPKPAKDTSGALVSGLPSGFESTSATRSQREKFAEVVAKAGKAKAITQRLRGLLQEAGLRRLQPGDPLATRISSEAAKLDIEVKNVAELGALSGPDVGLIRRVVADPNSIASVLKDLPAQLDSVESWGEDAVSETAKSMNIQRVKASAEKGEVQIRNNNEVLWIPEARLKDAEADGFVATGERR